jgi:hypothetical protein
MDTWAYQALIRKPRPMNSSNTPDQRMMQPPHLDCVKEGIPYMGTAAPTDWSSDHPVMSHGLIGNEFPPLSQGCRSA